MIVRPKTHSMGYWNADTRLVRCSGQYLCAACKSDPEARPHGPYTVLRRRSPVTGKHDKPIYLGRVDDPQFYCDVANQFFRLSHRPTKEEIFATAETVEYEEEE